MTEDATIYAISLYQGLVSRSQAATFSFIESTWMGELSHGALQKITLQSRSDYTRYKFNVDLLELPPA